MSSYRGAVLVAGVTGVAILGGLAAVAAQDSWSPSEIVSATSEPDIPVVDTTDCRFPSFSEASPPWRMRADDFRMRAHLQSVLTERFGRITKVDPGPRLDHGLIGLGHDGAVQGFVAVVDPGLVDVAELDAALKKAARAKEKELSSTRTTPVRAQAGCHSAAELREAYDVLREVRDRRPPVLSSSFHLAPEASAYRVFVPPGSPTVEELTTRLGDRVIVDEVAFGVDGSGKK
jgi:hypothetical protein